MDDAVGGGPGGTFFLAPSKLFNMFENKRTRKVKRVFERKENIERENTEKNNFYKKVYKRIVSKRWSLL